MDDDGSRQATRALIILLSREVRQLDKEQTPQERALELIRLLVPGGRPTTKSVLWAIRIALVLVVLIAIGYAYDITLWDWAKLLIVPAVLAAGGIWFNQQQRARELELEEQRTQDTALQAYLDQMGVMLTDIDAIHARLLDQRNFTERPLVRSRTLTVLEGFRPDTDLRSQARKFIVLRFLYEARLIRKPAEIITSANLRGLNLERFDLEAASLNLVNLEDAYLAGARLENADLISANLRSATLRSVSLRKATMISADLRDADLSLADLTGADLSFADLRGADLRGARFDGTNVSGCKVTEQQARDYVDIFIEPTRAR